MNSTIQSKFFTRLLGGLSLMRMFLLLPHNAKADDIPGTGTTPCPTRTGFGCVDPNYTSVRSAPNASAGEPLEKTNTSGTSPSFLPAPAGPSGAFWIAPLGDVEFGNPGDVFDWQTTFTTPTTIATGDCPVGVSIALTCITVSGTLAVNGSVAVSVDGGGKFVGVESLTSLGSFSVTVPINPATTTHNLDFVFNGCITFPSCNDPSFGASEPVVGLLVDPSWSLSAPGTPIDTTPLSEMLADGGVAPMNSTVPEPGSLLLLGTGMLGMMGAARRKLLV